MRFDQVKFGDVCSFVRGPFGGALKKDSFVSDGCAVYEQQHAIYNQFDNIRYFIDEEKFKSMERFELKAGDLIMSCSGTMGKIAIVPKGIAKGIINQALLKISPSKKVDINYLRYWMESESFQNSINRTNGSAIQNVSSVKILKEVEIPLPPLETQKQIAAVLEKADQLRKDCQQMEQELNSLAQSVFIDMFGDPVTNPKGWETKKFSELGELARGKSKHRPRNDPDLLGGKYPLIQTGDVARAGDYIVAHKSTYSDLGLKQSRLWPKGTLCITIAANIADTAILNFDACFPDSVVGFIPSKKFVLTEFVHYWLVFYQKVLIEMAPESAQKNINLGILDGLDIYVPPKELQGKFLKTFEHININREILVKESTEADEYFNALMQSAFKGELNLKPSKTKAA